MSGQEYDRLKAIIDDNLMDFLPCIDIKSSFLREAMEYSLTAGGKRIRPILLLMACKLAGGNEIAALPYAIACEYVHTYSLIHDDLPSMDNDDLRRGKPTNHKIYGEGMAILAGDGLLNTAFEMMYKDMMLYFDNDKMLKQRIRAAHAIAKGAGVRGMIAGQVADLEGANKQCAKEYLDYIHLNKTGALITAVIMAGAYLGDADDDLMCDLGIYSENLGLAFQIRDDILDVVGTEETIGKKTGVDEKLCKITYPAIYGIDESIKIFNDYIDKARDIMDKYDEKAKGLVYILNLLKERVA